MKNFIFLVLGAGIGSGVTFLIVRDRYERKLKAEREKMIEEVNDLKNKDTKEPKTIEQEVEKIISNYTPITVDDADLNKKEEIMDNQLSIDDIKEKPYIISADEFDTKGYEIRYWYLYNDDVLIDETNNIITTQEAEYSLGDCLKDDWDDDYVIHIRNDYDETDYEIKKIDQDYIEEDEDDEL